MNNTVIILNMSDTSINNLLVTSGFIIGILSCVYYTMQFSLLALLDFKTSDFYCGVVYSAILIVLKVTTC